jgi:hypothetical protein
MYNWVVSGLTCLAILNGLAGKKTGPTSLNTSAADLYLYTC